MSELKRCPFCGGEAKLEQEKIVGLYTVTCKDCFARIPFQFDFGEGLEVSKEKAIKAWNTRKPMQNIVGRLEETKTKSYVTGITSNPYEFGACHAMNDAIKIVKEEGEINDNT